MHGRLFARFFWRFPTHSLLGTTTSSSSSTSSPRSSPPGLSTRPCFSTTPTSCPGQGLVPFSVKNRDELAIFRVGSFRPVRPIPPIFASFRPLGHVKQRRMPRKSPLALDLGLKHMRPACEHSRGWRSLSALPGKPRGLGGWVGGHVATHTHFLEVCGIGFPPCREVRQPSLTCAVRFVIVWAEFQCHTGVNGASGKGCPPPPKLPLWPCVARGGGSVGSASGVGRGLIQGVSRSRVPLTQFLLLQCPPPNRKVSLPLCYLQIWELFAHCPFPTTPPGCILFKGLAKLRV